MKTLYFVSLVALAGLVGCAEIATLHCGNVNEYAFGERAGQAGRSKAALQSEIATCAATEHPLDERRVMAGYEAGRLAYCSPEGAFRTGQAGLSIRPVCTAGERAGMGRAHRLGQQDRELQVRVRSLTGERRELREARAALGPDDDAEARRLGDEISRLTRRIERLEDRRLLLSLFDG
ncbi:DUF2799 domain-containing protein [Jannaschia marina]|uniref:DUF2799 domain-containing protein n=1 Tax=Jannaschia marina TaxID=2741674 RepID=UPI0015CC6F06|nr:DUF2799 domain-containing protein [Jannaschia marina]